MRPPSPTEIETALRRLAEVLVGWGAIKIVLFGSVARGDYTATSDIDLIVINQRALTATRAILGRHLPPPMTGAA